MSTTRGTWNYRVVRRDSGEHLPGETFLAIREAHYEEDEEKPVSINVSATTAQGGALEESAEVLDMMREALSKPVPGYDDFREGVPEIDRGSQASLLAAPITPRTVGGR